MICCRPSLQLLLAALSLAASACTRDKYLEDYRPEPAKAVLDFYPPEQVTAGNESSFAPDLSPNGEFVVYTSDRKGNEDLWEKQTRGGFARQLTLHSADDFSPVVSPDGKKIAFVSRRDDAAGDIHVIARGGFSLSRFFGNGEGPVVGISSPLTEDTNPSWYPGGDRLVFAARGPGEAVPQLMTADLDDLKPVPLGDNHGDQPEVSPDGKQIVYVRGGALYLYHEDTDRTEQLTDGGTVQDGQPRFTDDGQALVFIRYADDTNGDDKLNGDDRPTIWRLDLNRQRQAATRENYDLEPLTAATYAAFSPQIRGPYVYLALQTTEGLNIFRLPATGQAPAPADLAAMQRQFDRRTDPDEKTFILRRAQAGFSLAHQPELVGEAALAELDWHVAGGRRAAATWVQAKLEANFKDRAALVALSKLALVSLDLDPLSYPRYTAELTDAQMQQLKALESRATALVAPFTKNDPLSRRVAGRSLLVRARILAAERRFFDANGLLATLLATYGDDRALDAQAALAAATLTPATSDVDSAIRALRQVVAKYPDDHDVVLAASKEAIRLLETRKDRLEALVALRTDAKGLPTMPALAHRRVADLYMEQGLEPVAANELRQLVDLYPESPLVTLDAAARLAVLEEKAGRYDAGEAMLDRLQERFKDAPPDLKERARGLLVNFLLRHGESLLKQKESGMAAKAYDKVLALEPLNISGHRGRIDAARMQGTLEPLKAEYEARADENPESAELLYVYGYAKTYEIDDGTSPAARLSAIDDGIKILERARELNSQLLDIHQTLGWLYMQKNFTTHEYQRSGSVLAGAERRADIVAGFFGGGDPDWRELAIDAYQNAYFLSQPGSIERAGLAQNLGQAYFSLRNYTKSLAYYLQRIRLLPVIPMRNASAEAILFDRAGRSAFQTDELELAESLQLRALSAWETVGNEERIAYALDALALTLRERSKYKDAIAIYERLDRLQARLGARANRVGTLSNLGYCAFMDGQLPVALTQLAAAEAELTGVQDAAIAAGDDPNAPQGSDAIQVDLGGQGSAAKGFDLFGRHVLILTFRAQIYEKLDRLDLALATLEAKLQLLKDGQENDKRNLAEEISVAENNLGELRLKAGYHLKARDAFADASAMAKTRRAKDQAFKAPSEVLNDLNRARVQLRLASLGLLAKEEVEADAKDLEATADGLRPVVKQGARAEAKPLGELLAVSSSLRAVSGAADADARRKASLEESLALLKSGDAPKDALDGVLLAYDDSTGGRASDASLTGLVSEFHKRALADPGLEWKLEASAGHDAKAFEAFDRFVASGGVLKSPADRLAARTVFETQLDAEGGDPERRELMLRRYLLIRETELVQRSGLDKARFTKLLSLKETAQITAALASGDAVLLAHRTRGGRLHVFLRNKQRLAAVTLPPPAGKAGTPAAVTAALAQALAAPDLAAALPAPGGRLYIVPSAELYDAAWETLPLAGQPLAKRQILAFLPAADLLPDAQALRSLPKRSVGQIAAPNGSDVIKAANVERDYAAIALDGQTPLGAKLAAFDLVHADAPLWLNDVEPGQSALVTATGKSAADAQNDLTIKQLAALRLPSTTALILADVRRDVRDLAPSGEGDDGWVLLSLAAASARVPSVLVVERPAAAAGAPLPALPPVDWAAFYQALATQSLGEAVSAAAVPGRLLGYAGIPAAEEVAYASAQLPKAIDAAEDAKADGDYVAAASAYKQALAYAERSGKTKDEVKILNGLVLTLFAARDFESALHFKMKLVDRARPAGKGDDKDPVDYANALVEAAVIAVKAEHHAEAQAMLAEAEKIDTGEGETAALGQIWHYRGVDLEAQQKYDETIAAYEKSQAFYAKIKPEEAANRQLDIANVYQKDLSDYGKALDGYVAAIAAYRKLGKKDAYLPVLIDKATTQIAIGQLQAATLTLEQEALPAIDLQKQRVLWVRATQTLANADYLAGLYREASERNEAALRESAKVEPKAARVDRQLEAIGLRGMIRAKLGQYREAFDDFRGAIALAKEYNNQSQLALLYNNYGFWAREYGAVDQSIDFFNVALKIDTELKAKSSIAYDNRNLGLSIILKGDYGRARDLLTDAMRTSEELHLAYNLAYCYFGLGDIAMREQKWADAEGWFKKALATSERSYMQDFVWRAYAGVGGAYRRQGKLDEAAQMDAAAVGVIERLRAGLQSDDSRNDFYSDAGVQEVYEAYAAVLMQQGRAAEAWEIAERSRARAFLDAFGTQKLQLARAASQRLLAEEAERRSAVEDAERRAGQGGAAEQAALAAAKAKEAETLARMRATDRQLVEFVKVDVAGPAELGRLLGANTALVEYLVTPDELLVWVVRDGQVHGRSVPVSRKDLVARIRDFRLLMENYSSTDYLGRELADLLLKPVEGELAGAKRLAVVPHAALHFLPFAALPTADGGMVIDRFSLYYLDAATMARFATPAAGRRLGAEARILAVANPTTGDDLPDLPFAGKEADVIGRYFNGVAVREGAEATPGAVRLAATSVDVLHLAAHGEFRPSAPAESRLRLAPEPGDDGSLTVGQIFGLASQADLVVLSACDSGLGKISAGDEVVGMDRAFFYAGASSVVASLWRISDVASAVTMKRFYRYLAEGQDRAEALRQAQLVVRRYFRHPAYWSAFRLFGDAQ